MAKKRKSRGPWTAAQKQASRQRWAAKKAQQGRDAVQATALTSGATVSEVEYETEFDIMQDIQKCLNKLTYDQKQIVVQYFAAKYK